MAKYSGKIGFLKTIETAPGVSMPKTIERKYYGDILRNNRRWAPQSNTINDDIQIDNQISIVADKFAGENIGYMRYATFMGNKYKITSASIEYPRITLTLGGLYNEQTDTSDSP